VFSRNRSIPNRSLVHLPEDSPVLPVRRPMALPPSASEPARQAAILATDGPA